MQIIVQAGAPEVPPTMGEWVFTLRPPGHNPSYIEIALYIYIIYISHIYIYIYSILYNKLNHQHLPHN